MFSRRRTLLVILWLFFLLQLSVTGVKAQATSEEQLQEQRDQERLKAQRKKDAEQKTRAKARDEVDQRRRTNRDLKREYIGKQRNTDLDEQRERGARP